MKIEIKMGYIDDKFEPKDVIDALTEFGLAENEILEVEPTLHNFMVTFFAALLKCGFACTVAKRKDLERAETTLIKLVTQVRGELAQYLEKDE